jgi:hypothetical protein
MSDFLWIGWAATALTVSSYFCRNPRTLRMVQATAALVWICYGVVLRSNPVIAANVLVTAVAVWTTVRGPGSTD